MLLLVHRSSSPPASHEVEASYFDAARFLAHSLRNIMLIK